ncbi:MAG: GNAT family N-acetyltransferase [Dehalococcoidia bacterium]
MTIKVVRSDDPGWVLEHGATFLNAEPVLHNVILTLLHEREAHGEPGRYWLATEAGAPAGLVFQSPLTFFASLACMTPEVIEAMVDAISEEGVALPGVIGEAATAARFAGQWTERRKSAARPLDGQRVYEIENVAEGALVSGQFRKGLRENRDLIVSWLREFQEEVGEGGGSDPELIVDRRQYWLWDDGRPVSMAGSTEPVEGVARVQAVYTPPANRNRGYAGACVGELSRLMLEGGRRCMLYTDLGNPVSNSIYRRIGYRAVAEVLRYRFE